MDNMPPIFERLQKQDAPREQREPSPGDVLAFAQLDYAERRWVKSGSKADFCVSVMVHTALFERVEEALADRNWIEAEAAHQKFVQLGLAINEIHKRRKAGWREEILDLLNKTYAEWEKSAEYSEEGEHIGPWRWNILSQCDDFEAAGITSEDDLLQLHVDPISQSAEPTLGPRVLRRQLAAIADMAADRYSYVKAVVGVSWLMSHPLAKQLGFTVWNEIECDQHGLNLWSQLMTKDGKIDQSRWKHLLETEEFPYAVKFGSIELETFLQKYLSAERRKSPVVFQEVDPLWRNQERIFREQVIALSARLKEAWPRLTGEEIESCIRGFPMVSRTLIEAGIMQEVLLRLKNEKKNGISFESSLFDFPRMEELEEKMFEQRMKHKYKKGRTVLFHEE